MINLQLTTKRNQWIAIRVQEIAIRVGDLGIFLFLFKMVALQ